MRLIPKQIWSLALLLLCGTLAGCSKAKQAPVSPSTSIPTPIATPAKSAPPLARLEKFHPKVDYRKRQNLVWEAVSLNLPLRRFDAVQTHERAGARIQFLSGSQLKIQENTLVVLDRDPSERARPREDRVVLRDGALEGSTRTELWLLTSGALLRLRPERNGKPGVAKISVNEGSSVHVKLAAGEAVLINPHRLVGGAPERIAVGKNVPIVLPAPKFTDSGNQAIESNWTRVDSAARLLTPPPEVQLTLSEPSDGTEVSSTTVQVSGMVSGSGARILVNGQEVPIAANLRFQVSQPLDPGANVIVVQLIRPSGKVEFQRRTVVRKETGQ